MTVVSESGTGHDADVARFLSRYPPFKGVGHAALEEIAASVVAQVVPAGDAVLVERGTPGTHLYVVMKGSMELVARGERVTPRRDRRAVGFWALLAALQLSVVIFLVSRERTSVRHDHDDCAHRVQPNVAHFEIVPVRDQGRRASVRGHQ